MKPTMYLTGNEKSVYRNIKHQLAGLDFIYFEDIYPLVKDRYSENQLKGIIGSLNKKGLIWVDHSLNGQIGFPINGGQEIMYDLPSERLKTERVQLWHDNVMMTAQLTLETAQHMVDFETASVITDQAILVLRK